MQGRRRGREAGRIKLVERWLTELFIADAGKCCDFIERLKKSFTTLRIRLDEKIDDAPAGIARGRRAGDGRETKGEKRRKSSLPLGPVHRRIVKSRHCGAADEKAA